MLSFKEFIIEVVATKSKGKDSDDQGKLHELLVGAHLNRLIHGHHAHMSHFRDEHGKSPEGAHNDIAKRIHPNEYQTQSNEAAEASEKIHKHLKEHHPDVLKSSKDTHVRVSWTSQPSDHENLTGKSDSGASGGGADVMITKHDKTGHATHAVGYSLKRAKGTITLANRGGGSLEDELKMPKGSLTKHDNEHDERTSKILESHNTTGKKLTQESKHQIYKSARDATKRTPKQQKMMDDVNASDKERNTKQAEAIASHLHKNKHLVSNLISPKHTFPHYQAETVPGKGHTNIQDLHEKVEKHLGKGDFDVKHDGSFVKINQKSTGKPLANLEVRSKGKPAGTASNVCPHVSKTIENT